MYKSYIGHLIGMRKLVKRATYEMVARLVRNWQLVT